MLILRLIDKWEGELSSISRRGTLIDMYMYITGIEVTGYLLTEDAVCMSPKISCGRRPVF